LGVDAAASEFYKNGKYSFGGKALSAQKLGEKYAGWTNEFNVKSIEDPFAENDWGEWARFMKKTSVQVVGDDLVCTRKQLVEKAVGQKAVNAAIIKLNQVGTITEALETLDYCFKHNIAASISHRGGETNDSFIADFVVGTGAGQCKFGGLSRGERIAKYNRLMEIYGKEKFGYAGRNFAQKYC
ncbi:phosphopyruvate hydratase, partial [Candidatus Micrarchaeota archaeon]|nr:phosphopyruvate hydratase [Candidatus Micrarchaeota archaeon]